MSARRVYGIAGAAVFAFTLQACSGSGRTDSGEHYSTTTSGTCGCCGTVVEIGPNQRCSDPATCAEACAAADASSDAPDSDAGDARAE